MNNGADKSATGELAGDNVSPIDLRTSEIRYRRLFESARDGILILDAVTRQITDANPFMVELLGYSREELLGKELWEIGLPRDVRASTDAFRELQEKGYIRYEDLPLQTRQGQSRYVEFISNVYREDDRLVIQCNIRDTTERKLAQHDTLRLAAIVESSDDAIISKNMDGIITTWNMGAQRLYGYTSEEAIGRPVSFLAPPNLPDEMPQLLAKVRRGETVEHYETVRLCKDGSQRNISLSLSPLRDAQGNLIGVSSIKRDITHRRKTESAFKDIQLRHHSLFENMFEGYACCRTVFEEDQLRDFVYESVNTAFEKQTGLKNVVGKSVSEVIPGLVEANAELFQMYGRVALTGHAEKCETYISALNLWLSIAAYSHEKGHFVAIFEDITERKQADARLTESRQRLALATESARIGIWDLDVVENVLVWDEQMYALYGISAHDFTGAYDAWQKGLHPEDRERAEAGLNAALKGKGGFHSQFRVLWPDGETRHIEAHALVVRTGDGTPLHMIGVNWDITEGKKAEAALLGMRDQLELRVQKRTLELENVNAALQAKEAEQQQIMDTLTQSEERFRLLVESVHDYAILMLDTTGHIMMWNAGAERMKGYRAEEIIGRHFSCFYTEEDRQAGTPKIQLDIAKAEGYLDYEGWRVRNDGSRFWATLVMTALRDDKGQLRGFAKITRDITERKNIEAALHEAKDQADAANLAKSEFLSRMSHELRTPLNAILGFGQLLEMQDFAPAQQERVQHILKAGKHLLNLINEVLDIARIESGHMLLSSEPVQVSEAIEEVFALLRPLAAERGIRFEGADNPELEVYVWADRQRLKQVLLNLCSNAIKYNRPQGSIGVTCRRIANQCVTSQDELVLPTLKDTTANDLLRICVTDSGVGIAASAQAHLFMPFMRVGTEQATIEGTGLGLTLSLSLAQAMGGTIGMESTVGVGSTFWLQLPMTSDPSTKTGETLPSGSALPETVQASAPSTCYTLLYIEDNLSNLKLIENIIGGQPAYQLLTASKGKSGLDMARQEHPDLILLDLHIPDMPGDQILAHLKADPATAEIPVVMLSAVAMESEIKRLLSSGASAYLTKPLDIKEFLKTLSGILQPTS